MKVGARILISLGSVAFPGLGHGVMSRRKSAIAVPLVELLVIWSWLWVPRLVLGLVLLLLANAIVTFRLLRRFASPAPPSSDPPTAVIAGNVPEPRVPQPNGRLAIIAILITVIGFAVSRQFIGTSQMKSGSMAPTIVTGDRVLIETLSLLWSAPAHGDVIVYQSPCRRGQMLAGRVIALGGETVEERCGHVFVNGTEIPTTAVDGPCWYDNLDGDGEWFTRACTRAHESHGGHDYDVIHRPASTQSEDDEPAGFPDGLLPTCPMGSSGTGSKPGNAVITNTDAGPCAQQLHYVVPEGHLFVMGDTRDDAYDSRSFGPVPVDLVKGRARSILMSNGRSGPTMSRAGRIE